MVASRPPALDRGYSLLKQTVRRGLDRAMQPYVEQVVARQGAQVAALAGPGPSGPPASPPEASPPPGELLHHALHTARTIALSGMPR